MGFLCIQLPYSRKQKHVRASACDSITSQLVTSHVTNWTQIWLLTCPKYVFAFLEHAYAVLEHAYAVLEQVYAVLELFYAVLEQGDVTNWDFMKQNF